jgi:RNA recognition motif-containing protein
LFGIEITRLREMNIYVGNLPYATTEDELREMFSQYGEITSLNIIRDKFTGSSKGFGFVEMADRASAQSAIEALNGTEMGGRALTVNEARPKPQGGRRDRDW